MLHSRIRRLVRALPAVACLAAALVVPSAAHAQETSSVAAAAELTRLLDAAELESIAAVSAEDPAHWVAALYFKGSQLLVVSAQYSAPVLLTAKLKEGDYRDIYLALFSSPVSGTKQFVMDSGANGLVARPNDDGPDMWEEKNRTVTFDGEWRRAKISEADYRKALSEADDAYTRMLKLLASQLKKPSGTQP